MLSIPRALPPVTQGSALQAPERMRGIGAVIAIQAPECIWRPIRGRETINGTGNSPPGVGYRCGSGGAFFLLPTAAILLCGFPSVSRADQKGGEAQTGKLACMDEHHYLTVRA